MAASRGCSTIFYLSKKICRFPVLHWYDIKLNRFPLTTKALTAGLLMMFGDGICQMITIRSKRSSLSTSKVNEKNISKSILKDGYCQFQLRRNFSMMVTGLTFIGPLLHKWYQILSFLSPTSPFKRVLIDQLCLAPILIPIYFSYLYFLEGKISEIYNIPSMYWSILLNNWLLWIPAQSINFSLVPQNYRVFYVNIVAIFWNIYISSVAHKNQENQIFNNSQNVHESSKSEA